MHNILWSFNSSVSSVNTSRFKNVKTTTLSLQYNNLAFREIQIFKKIIRQCEWLEISKAYPPTLLTKKSYKTFKQFWLEIGVNPVDIKFLQKIGRIRSLVNHNFYKNGITIQICRPYKIQILTQTRKVIIEKRKKRKLTN